jgi:hypothetical protein
MTSLPVAANTSPIFIQRSEVIAQIRLTNQTISRDGTGGTPVIWYDPTVLGYGNGAIVDSIRIEAIGINVATQFYLFTQKASFSPLRWAKVGEVNVPAVTGIPNNAGVTSGGTFPILFPLPVINSLPTATSALTLDADGAIWGCALGTAIAGGIEVSFIGGYY